MSSITRKEFRNPVRRTIQQKKVLDESYMALFSAIESLLEHSDQFSDNDIEQLEKVKVIARDIYLDRLVEEYFMQTIGNTFSHLQHLTSILYSQKRRKKDTEKLFYYRNSRLIQNG